MVFQINLSWKRIENIKCQVKQSVFHVSKRWETLLKLKRPVTDFKSSKHQGALCVRGWTETQEFALKMTLTVKYQNTKLLVAK